MMMTPTKLVTSPTKSMVSPTKSMVSPTKSPTKSNSVSLMSPTKEKGFTIGRSTVFENQSSLETDTANAEFETTFSNLRKLTVEI